MSQADKDVKRRTNRGGMGGGPGHGGGPVEKAKDFKGTFKRLVKYIGKNKAPILIVFLMAIGSTVFMIVGPKNAWIGNNDTCRRYRIKVQWGIC